MVGQLHLGRHLRFLVALDQKDPASKHDKLTTSYNVFDIANLVMLFVLWTHGQLVIDILCILRWLYSCPAMGHYKRKMYNVEL